MTRLALLAGVVLLTGCSGLLLPPPPEEPTHLYQLQLEAPLTEISPTPKKERHGTIMVEQPQVAAGYGTTAIAYRRGPWEIHYYSKSRWIDNPAVMLRGAITSALNEVGPFREAIETPSGIAVNYSLQTKLLRLVQDFSNAPPSQEQLVVRVTLVDVARGVILASQVLNFNVAAPTEDARGGVVAANKALQQLAAEMVEFCRNALASRASDRP